MKTIEQVNLFSPEHYHNPYQDYDILRQAGPVCRVSDSQGGYFWIVTGFEEGQQVLRNPLFLNHYERFMTPAQLDPQADQSYPRELRILEHNMLSSDAPKHTRLRALVSKAFTPRRVEELRPSIERIAADLLDALVGQHETDLVDSYTLPLPVRVISELLAIPAEDQARFRQWANSMIRSDAGAQQHEAHRVATISFIRYCEELVEKRRQQPGSDMVSALIAAEEQGEKLSQDELIAMIWILLIAGYETTVNLVGSGVLALLQHPDQLAKLRQEPALIKSAVEEFLRFQSPVDVSAFRYANQDIELGGQTIKKGDRLMVALGGANHDPQQFTDPYRLDITRANNQHVAFGYGIHFCLGAPLARLEGQIAIPALLNRYPNLRLAVPESEIKWRPSLLLRGVQHLPVYLD